MQTHSRDYYLTLRRRYEPDKARLVIIAESPPASGLYFYDDAGRTTEPLFAAIMRRLNFASATKEDGLREMQRRGWVLVDATYQQVDQLSVSGRDAVIMRDYPLLRDDLARLLPDRTIPLILLKANVCRALEAKLIGDGFKVLNCGRVVYFPSTGHQQKFEAQFETCLNSLGTNC